MDTSKKESELAEGLFNPTTPGGAPLLDKKVPVAPPQAHQAPNSLLSTIIACLLKARGQETEMKTNVAALVAERHRHFHVTRTKPDVNWRQCTNPVCQQAVRLLEKTGSEDISLTPLELKSVHNKRILFDVRLGHMHVYMEDVPLIEVPQNRIIHP